MELLRSLSRAFVSGCVGVVGFFIGAYLFIAVGLIDAPPVVETFQSKAFIYKQVVWGGIWGLLFVLPLLRPFWWARGLIVGGLATLAAIFVFQPEEIGRAPSELQSLMRISYAVFCLNKKHIIMQEKKE